MHRKSVALLCALFVSVCFTQPARPHDSLLPNMVTPLGHSDRVTEVAVSRDGAFTDTASRDVSLTNSTSQSVTVTPVLQVGHHALVKDLAFSSDEKTLASASWDGSVRIWDWSTGRLLRTFVGSGKQAESVSFKPNSSLIASIDETGVFIWDYRTGLGTESLKISGAQQIAFTPDGDTLAIATLRGVYLWRQGTLDAKPLQLSGEDARAIAVSPDGKLMASGNANSTVHIFELRSHKLLRTIRADEAWIWSVAFLPDSSRLASGSINGVRIWEASSGRQLAQLGDRSYVWHLSINARSEILAYTSGKPCLWDTKSGNRIRCFDLASADFGAAVFSKTGAFAAFSSAVPSVLDVASGKRLNGSDSAGGFAEIAAFSPTGEQLYTSDSSGTRLLDLTTGATLWSLVDERSYDANDFAFAARSNVLVQGRSTSRTMSIVDTNTGRELDVLHPTGLDLTMVTFVGSSHRLVAGSAQGEIVTFDLDARRETSRHKIGSRPVNVVTSQRTKDEFLIGDESGKWCRFVAGATDQPQCVQRSHKAEYGVLTGAGQRALLAEVDGYYKQVEYDFQSGRVIQDFGVGSPAAAVQAGGPALFQNYQLRSPDTGPPILKIDTARALESAKLSDDGAVLALLNIDGEFFLELARAGTRALTSPVRNNVRAFALCDAKGDEIAYLDRQGKVFLSNSGKAPRLLFDTYIDSLHGSVDCSTDGRYVAVVDDTTIHAWDRREAHDFVLGPRQPSSVKPLAVSADGQELVTGGNRDAYVWSLPHREEIQVLGGSRDNSRISSAAYDPQGELLATGSYDGWLTLWRRQDKGRWQSISKAPAHKYSVSAIAISNEGLVASVDAIEQAIVLWKPVGDTLQEQWRRADIGISQVFTFHFNAAGTTLHVSGRNGGINSNSSTNPKEIIGPAGLDVTTGKPLPRVWTHEEDFIALTSDAAERLVAITAVNGWLSLLDFRTGQRIARIVFGARGSSVAIDESNRFEPSDLSNVPTLYWSFSDDPLRLHGLEITMRDYYEPRLIPRVLACRASDSCGQTFSKTRPLAELNRVRPDVKIVNVRRGISADVAVIDVKVEAKEDRSQKNGKTKTGAYDLRLFRDGQLVGQWPGPERPVRGLDDLESWRNDTRVVSVGESKLVSFEVRLPSRAKGQTIVFSAYAFNEDRVKSETVSNDSYKIPDDITPRPPTAYLLTIGINAYENQNLQLSFAAKDANDILKSLQQIPGYEMVPISLISDNAHENGATPVDQATKNNIRSVLYLLAGSAEDRRELVREAIGSQVDKLLKATPDDLVIVTFSGHGYTDAQGRFYLVPSDSGRGKIANSLSRLVSSEELSEWLHQVDAGQMVMIIDACHSAASVETPGFKPGPMGDSGFGQLAYDKGMRILAATQAEDVALESEKVGQGLLTYALVHEGLGLGRERPDWPADLDGDGTVTIKEWLGYGAKRVPALYEDIRSGKLRSRDPIAVDRLEKIAQQAQTPALFDFSKRLADDVVRRRSR